MAKKFFFVCVLINMVVAGFAQAQVGDREIVHAIYEVNYFFAFTAGGDVYHAQKYNEDIRDWEYVNNVFDSQVDGQRVVHVIYEVGYFFAFTEDGKTYRAQKYNENIMAWEYDNSIFDGVVSSGSSSLDGFKSNFR